MSYPTMVTIPIEIDARITPNSRAHWRTRAKIQREMKNTTYTAMMAAGPHTSLHNAPLPLTISYIIGLAPRRQVMDDLNAIASMKYIEDGIAAYLGIDDRNFKFGGLEQVRAGKGNPGFVRVLISSEEAS
jgi:hypothetical protein